MNRSMMIGKIIIVKNGIGRDGEGEQDLTGVHGNQWDGEYTIMDGPMVIGNNPPNQYYLLQSNEGKGMHIMCIDSMHREWYFRKLGHWELKNEGGNSADDDVGVSVL
tara:strand:+ start:183 stop:503 length:321 start_codon:yes stop_codon:yes gene_type:complete